MTTVPPLPPAIVAENTHIIGQVTMLANGTLWFQWSTDELRKKRVDSSFSIRPGDWRYSRLLQFFGDLKPGESKAMPFQGPFTDEELAQGRSLRPED